jgi:hypothetical protein
VRWGCVQGAMDKVVGGVARACVASV